MACRAVVMRAYNVYALLRDLARKAVLFDQVKQCEEGSAETLKFWADREIHDRRLMAAADQACREYASHPHDVPILTVLEDE